MRPRWRARRRDGAARAAAVDAYVLPRPVVERFLREHPEVEAEDVALLEPAVRQWFRLLVRAPDVELAPPSRAVADLWLAFTTAEDDYAAFCEQVLGRYVPHRPPSRSPGEAPEGSAPADEELARTLDLARRDEPDAPDAPDGVPCLFRVDAAIRVLNGRRYLGTCGGGAECYPVGGTVCLRHLKGPDRRARRSPDLRRAGPGSTADGAVRRTGKLMP